MKIKEKRWNKNMEEEVINEWIEKSIYEFREGEKAKVYSIDTPPPYVNAPIHAGHAYTYVQMDIMARFHRMMGMNVLFPLGLDRNGLPIEIQAEKHYGIKMFETPRDEFLKKCEKMLNQASNVSSTAFKKLGISFNNYEKTGSLGNKYLTDSPEYRRITQKTFRKMWDDGLIYEDLKTTNYCPVCKTTIANSEVEYEEETTLLNNIEFRVYDTGDSIIISTTRPELLCACKAVLFNPDDERYQKYEGKKAVVPIYDRKVPIIPHPSAKPDFGTGILMICSFGDTADVRLFRELELEPIYCIDKDGKMNEESGEYEGMTVKEARKKIIKDLEERELLKKQKKIKHKYPICERSKNPIEFIAMKEYYLKQIEFVDELRKISDKISFFAPESKQILLDWFNSVSIDWPISRRRYYGTEIPIWYCKNCGHAHVAKGGRYVKPWKEESPIKKCPVCKESKGWEGETRVFDTWFDSSISELFILGYDRYQSFFENNFPCTMRPQGKEIVRTWLYYTLLRAYLLFKKPAFKQVWIHKHVVDEEGYKMSKSKGNVIDPMKIVEKYGAEGFRMWSVLEGDITKGDIRCSFERVKGATKFLTKIWNISRFISMFEEKKKPRKLDETDKWIIHELNSVIKKTRKYYEKYEFNNVGKLLRDFVWNTFASHYIEMVKKRAYNKDISALYTIHYCLKKILKIMSPIIPIITDKIWKKLYSKKSIHLEKYPEAGETEYKKHTENIIKFNSRIWSKKKEKNISLKKEIKAKIPEKLKKFKKDLTKMHHIIP